MNFAAEKPIYLQIVDVIADRILSGDLRGGDRIPSVREYGADIGVNPNTMMRSYEKLTADGVIYNRRGIGYFVADDARETVLSAQRKEFMEKELPAIRERMRLLGIDFSTLNETDHA
jgi:DNA-binding transcriptional regulator YhcF (GntR family)